MNPFSIFLPFSPQFSFRFIDWRRRSPHLPHPNTAATHPKCKVKRNYSLPLSCVGNKVENKEKEKKVFSDILKTDMAASSLVYRKVHSSLREKTMRSPKRQNRGRRRNWGSQLGFLFFTMLFLTLSTQIRNKVNADIDDSSRYDSLSSVAPNISSSHFGLNFTGERDLASRFKRDFSAISIK